MPESEAVVSDSSPLIWLSKVNRISLLEQLFGGVVIPMEVQREVCRGESADALLIREAIEVGWVRVEESKGHVDELLEVSGIHRGEAEALLLAKRLGFLFLVDDREASVVARVFGVDCVGTLGVLLIGLSEGLMGYDDFVKLVDEMIDLGFRLSVDVYQRVIKEAKKLV